jgi:hypothetical protein
MEGAAIFALGALFTHHYSQKTLERRDNVVAGFGQEQRIARQVLNPAYPAVEPKLNQVTDASFLRLVDPDELNTLRFNAKYGLHQPGMDWNTFRAIQMPGQQMGVDLTGAIQ